MDEAFRSPGNTYETLMNTIMDMAKVQPDSINTVSMIRIRKDGSFGVARRERKMGICFL